MKNKNALDIIENIDSKLIDEAENYKGKSKKNIRTKYIATAACLCLALALAVCAIMLKNGNTAIKTSDANAVNRSSNITVSTGIPAAADNSIYIPAVELPESSDGGNYDMIGLVVYKGGIYTQAEMYSGNDAIIIDKLVGDYLGYATGSINEWSTQEDYAEEFASSVPGRVYAVKGYDTSFRVCIREEFTDGNGEKQLFIQFFDRLNDIELTCGADLFETGLKLQGNISKIEYQSHADWNYNTGNVKNADIESEIWNAFLDEVDKGSFVNTWNSEIIENTIYDTEAQAHIILTMNDGTVIRLRLIEGGYVGYEPLGWYFVKIPGETFDKVYEACSANT